VARQVAGEQSAAGGRVVLIAGQAGGGEASGQHDRRGLAARVAGQLDTGVASPVLDD
jgi:hypothetical protein